MNTIFARRIALVALLLVSLSACDNDPVGTVNHSTTGGSQFEMIPPQKIATSRAVEPSALFVEVTVDGERVDMQTGTNGVRFGTIQLPENAELPVVVKWSESFDGAPLELAIAEKVLTVKGDASGNQEFSFVSNEFNYGSDFDQDDISNLQERNEDTNPRDPNDPAAPPVQVDVVVRIQLPDERILENAALLDSITPVATVDEKEVVLNREGNGWVGTTQVTQNSNAFTTVKFYQGPERRLELATAQFSADVGDGTEFNFASSLFVDSASFDNDKDGLSNLDELLEGYDPLDSGNPARDPCDISNFELGCTVDTDGDGKSDSQETETLDTDQDGTPNYLESTLEDNDQDGRNAEVDIDDEDPCAPSASNPACVGQQTDTDQDGKTDAQEGDADTDGDGIPDFRESAILDEDGDTVFDELDEENEDPCVPSVTSAACIATQTDTDLDGKSDIEEGDADTDGDGVPDFQESAILDEDDDGLSDEEDIDNADPCVPSVTSAACVATQTDTDLDGKTDVEEGLGDSDGDGIPDFQESAILDEDNDGESDEDDPDNSDPCVPSELSPACVVLQTDSDLDGKTDLEEGTADSDGDGIPDYLDSAILDQDDDTIVDEEDEDNEDPCKPLATSAACVATQLDTDEDGETDLEEGLGDADGDGIPDYLESDILDEDSDTISDEADSDNEDPCIPSTLNDACGIVQRDSDDDGKTDVEEGLVDTDMDGLPDYLESAILDLDNDGIVDELDIVNGDPCLPSADNLACAAADPDEL